MNFKLYGAAGWLIGYLTAWALAIRLVINFHKVQYKFIETDCYISTAAAKGHRVIVRSEELTFSNGIVLRVNNQMRYFKFGELALRASAPKLHRILRSIYDALGPVFAKFLFLPILADAAYLTLKPAEWLCCSFYKVLFGNDKSFINRIYNN